ncbi:uncharacterized protein [Diadema antillarum]|uniref:uncharacterized protein n=1 Tax=Diadema antillarum TaxID=105358 RepID=UPI003A87883F
MGTLVLTLLLGSLACHVLGQGFPGNPGGGFPGQGNPNFPGQGNPNFPGQGNPNFPGQGGPGGNFPGQGGPGGNFPGQGNPGGGFPGQGNPNFPGQGNPNFPGQGNPGGNFPGARPGAPGFPAGGGPGGPGFGPNNPPLLGCRPGWTNFGNFCYKYFWQRLPYDQANRVCQRFSATAVQGSHIRPPPGHLIVSKDIQHNKFQHNWLRYTGGGNNKIWMGLAELPSDPESNRYFWADGTEFFYTRGYPIFSRFKPDQPQQNAHRQGVHSFNNRPDNTWVTTSVETEVSFICQYQYKV